MRRPHRLIFAAVLISFSGVLAGCSSGFGSNFDPSDLLDWLDTKKKLQGDRKPVFPDGVPGLEQGVPKELYKDNVERQERLDEQSAAAAAAPQPAPEAPAAAPKGKKASMSKKPATASAAPAEPDGEAEAAGQEGTPAAPPPHKPKKIVRKRTTAPPADQPAQAAAPQATSQPAQSAQQSQTPFPAPLPGGSFTR